MNTSVVILNPHARQGRAAQLAQPMRDWLQAQGLAAQVQVCATPESLAAVFAALPEGSRVVGVGGDGTNHRLLPHLLAGRHSYGIVPFGSGDDVARAIGVWGWGWPQALHHALTAPAHGMDVGHVRDPDSGLQRHFLGCFLLGLDALVNNQTSGWKFKGPLPYVLTLLHHLRRLPSWPLQVRATPAGPSAAPAPADALQLPAQPHVLCSLLNTPTYGSGYPVAPLARVNDGALQLLQAPQVSRLRFVRLFVHMLQGRHMGSAHIQMRAVTAVQVRSPQPLCLSADGEVMDWTCTGVDVQVLPGALPVAMAGRAAK